MSAVAVIGGGTMGTGIAHAFAAAGDHVTIVDANIGAARASVARARKVLDSAVRRGVVEADVAAAAGERLQGVESIGELPNGLDLIVEAVPERATLKHEVLAAAAAQQPGLLATNTSSIPLADLIAAVPNPGTFLGLHFFNPVWSSSLVEVVVADATSNAARKVALDHVARIGKEAILVRDAPGFATSRLGVALGLEAIRMVEDGVASADDVDRAMVLAYRHPMGPLRLTDLIGLDVRLDIARNLESHYGPRFAPPALLKDLVAEGRLGKKTGRGFHRWDS